ncbi:MAG: tetratricopeptide repeat protein [Candidatus Campbellbacteria bacterium]|nr:tetratricopeptide repeat protein [Candidatus Campbellbacteria bacterium]
METNDIVLRAFEAFAHADTNTFEEHIPALTENDSPLGKLLLGMYYINHGDEAEAEEALRECIALDENNFQALFNLALLLVGRDRVSEAIDYYEKAYELNNTHFSLIYNYALALHKRARETDDEEVYKKALELYFEALEINPGHINLRENTRGALEGINVSEEILEEFEAADSRATVKSFAQQVLRG